MVWVTTRVDSIHVGLDLKTKAWGQGSKEVALLFEGIKTMSSDEVLWYDEVLIEELAPLVDTAKLLARSAVYEGSEVGKGISVLIITCGVTSCDVSLHGGPICGTGPTWKVFPKVCGFDWCIMKCPPLPGIKIINATACKVLF
jgi:hypothetical protein